MEMPNENPYSIDVYPNPADNLLNINFTTDIATDVVYYISTLDGKIIYNGKLEQTSLGENLIEILLDENLPSQTLFINMVFDGKYYVTQKFLKE
jgi:hypothetical protein